MKRATKEREAYRKTTVFLQERETYLYITPVESLDVDPVFLPVTLERNLP